MGAEGGGGERGRVPCSVVTGFLGAGKTTLVNRILRAGHGKRVAVVENEFGEVGIDAGLVEGAVRAKEEIIELSNGCVCCSVRGDLVRVLKQLLAREAPPDHILVETTGLADPAPVAQSFYMDEDLKHGLTLDAVITVVDAKHVLLHLDEEREAGAVNECLQQVAFADRILLNKVDLVTDAQKAEVLGRLREVNAYCHVVETTQSDVSIDDVLGIGAFSLERMLEKGDAFAPQREATHSEAAGCGEAGSGGGGCGRGECKSAHCGGTEAPDCGACPDKCSDADCRQPHPPRGTKRSRHESSVTSVGLQCEGPVDMNAMNTWLSGLLREHGRDIYRSKGILCVKGTDHKFVFQGVHDLLMVASSEEGVGRPWLADEKRENKLVFIGKNLDRAQLEADFQTCLA